MNKISNDIINVAILNSKILGEDFIEAYIPFVSTLISKKQYDEFDIQQICEDFYSEYAFKIPAMPMTEILNRMVKMGILTKNRKGKIIPNYNKIIETDFNEVSRDNLMKFENIKNKYIKYANSYYGFHLEEGKAEENLCNFIKENYIETIINEEYIKNISVSLDNNEIKDDIYILYKFIIYLYEHEYELFKIIKNFCLGYTVAGALSLDNISSNKGNFTDKKIFFDTKFILRLLGVEGEFYKKSYKSIMDILKDNNCKLYIFRHTFDEIREILENAKNRMKQNKEYEENIPQVQRYFIEEKYSEGKINLFIATLEKKLKELGIYISSAEYIKSTDRYQIDEQQLYEQIISVYKNGNQNFDEESKKDTIYRDIKSIALIYREMKGNRSMALETSRNFFLTTNKALAYACKNFNKTLGKKEGIAPCITDIFLGTILWLQNPIRYDELKESQIIANCYAAIKPNSVMINKFSKEVDKLKNDNQITSEDYALLKDYEVLNSMLSDKVMGNIDNLNEDITYEILNDIKIELRRDLNEQLEEERRKTKKIEREKSKIERKNSETIEIIKKEAKKKAKIKVLGIAAISGILPIVIVVLDLWFNVVDLINSNNKLIVIVIRIIIYLLMAMLSIYTTVKEFKNLAETEKKEYKKICKKYKIESNN